MNLQMQFLVQLACECNLVNAARGGNNDEKNELLNVFLPRASNSLKLSLCSRTHRSNFDFPANRTRSSAAMSQSSELALSSSTTGVAFMKFARSLFSSRLMRASKASSTFFVEIAGSNKVAQQNCRFSSELYIQGFRVK